MEMPFRSHRKYRINMAVFENRDAISFYLLGAYLTDGCIYRNRSSHGSEAFVVDLASRDKDWLEVIKALVCPQKPIRIHGGAWHFRLTSRELAEWFLGNGCCERKSTILRLPIVPRRFVPYFIRGVFDGDGSVSIGFYKRRGFGPYPKVSLYLCSGSEAFAKGLYEILRK